MIKRAAILIGCLLALSVVAYAAHGEYGRAACAAAVKQNEIDAETVELCGKVLCSSPTYADMRGIVKRKREAQACQ